MKKLTKYMLNKILKEHQIWLDTNTKNGERANLSFSDLRGTNLRGADLRCADLRGADLRGTDLSCVDLRRADLGGTNLRGVNLSFADLRGANLRGANLSFSDSGGANLISANLEGADLRGADLRGADLGHADLRCANLGGTNLRGADLSCADLRGADLNDVTNMFSPIACPEKGSFIGFKKCKDDLIVEIEILEDSLRCSATSRKCRCSKARVISITNMDGTNSNLTTATSKHDVNFKYTIGEIVTVDDFDTNRWNECSTGIHFFITREEAVNY